MSVPVDPRKAWDLPAFGALPTVERLGELTTRVLAQNPSMMTLDGTNTYVVGVPGTGGAVVIDPGPDQPDHRARVEAVLAERDAELAAVLVTHHHGDHSEAAAAWATAHGAQLHATTPEVAGAHGTVLRGDSRLDIAGLVLDVVATPGHAADHVTYRLPDGDLVIGDHVLGRGTSVVAHPDGDLVAYLASLRRILDLDTDRLLPGHGPALGEDPHAVIRFYLDHRAHREGQVLTAITGRTATAREVVATVYWDVAPHLWPAAELSTLATLAKLRTEGRVRHDDPDLWSLT